MKKQIWIKMMAVCMLLLVACADATAKQKQMIERGMTKQQVREILGKPRIVSFDQDIDRWEYNKKEGGLLDPYYVRVIVDFDQNDRVVRYQSIDLDTPVNNGQAQRFPMPTEYGMRRGVMPPHLMEKYSLNDNEFSLLYNKIKKTSFDDNKLDMIEVASLRCYYTCEQCAKLLDLFSFSSNRLQALKLMSSYIVDPHNAYPIYQMFSFTGDKDKAAQILNGM